MTSHFSAHSQQVIAKLAGGDKTMRDQADRCYEWHLRNHGTAHRDPYFEFISEMNSPVPCYIQKDNARKRILADNPALTSHKDTSHE